MSVRVVVADDEPLGRRGIAVRLARHQGVEIVAECANGRAAADAVRRLSPDLLFLDVEMPGFDGFDVVATLGTPPHPYVVFVTAYERHATRAFDVQALDYVLKPIDDIRFDTAVRRALHALAQRSAPKGRFALREGAAVQFLPHEEVDWIEAAGDYVRLYTAGRYRLMRASLTEVESQVSAARFVRIHRSTIVNVDRVRGCRSLETGDFIVVLRAGAELRMSRSYRRALPRLAGAPPA